MKEHRKLDKKDPSHDQHLRRSKQAIDTLNAAFDKIDRFLKTQTPRMGQGKQRKEIKSNITDNESAKMSTSKGVIQGYNGVAAVDKKHQVIIDAQAFGHGQEHHALQPVLETIKDRYRRLRICQDIYQDSPAIRVTADTGYANEANIQYLHEKQRCMHKPEQADRSKGHGRQVSFTGA